LIVTLTLSAQVFLLKTTTAIQ